MAKNPVALGAALMNMLLNGAQLDKVPWYKRRFSVGKGSLFSRAGGRNRYNAPHQGAQEKARRVRQIASGFIKVQP
jgi:hypothetical protein